jgi:hypothetical protein
MGENFRIDFIVDGQLKLKVIRQHLNFLEFSKYLISISEKEEGFYFKYALKSLRYPLYGDVPAPFS